MQKGAQAPFCVGICNAAPVGRGLAPAAPHPECHPERSDAAKQQAQSKFCRAEWQRNEAEQNLTREIAKRFNEEGISGRFMTRLLALSSI